MKKKIMMGLCAILILGLAISAAPAAQEKESSDVAQDKRPSTIKELTIRNSGFRSRSTIVIRYRDEDKKIVGVTENGKNLPASEFSRYESVMRKILELPQIDRLIPDIERAKRRAESARISEESKIREMLELRRRLEGLESDIARRYRDINELQLMNELNRMAEKISESSDLSQEEKIAQIKDVLAKIQAMESAKKEEDRRRRLTEISTITATRRLIAEINKSEKMSKEEKIKEIQELLMRTRKMDLEREKSRRGNLVELEAANTIREMMREIAENKNLSDQEKKEELERLMKESQKMQLETMRPMITIEKFKFDLNQLLKKERLYPEGKAEFILKKHECTIDGKKVTKEIHEKILKLCEETLDKKFDKDTKIVLRLNEDN
jgi:hypothetical protein